MITSTTTRTTTTISATALALSVALLTGCASKSSPTPPATQPSAATREPGYWTDRPGYARVTAADFDRLWQSAQDTARAFGFTIDRQDFRGGVITTQPLISKQFFEVWRNDTQTLGDTAASSLNTYRRTLRFEFQRQPGGNRYQATPKVVVERYAQAEQPITSSVYLRNAFKSRRPVDRVGNAEIDRGVYLPRRYWYATGRDEALEEEVAESLRRRVLE